MKLYFQHSNGNLEHIGDVGNNAYVQAALDDLHRRNPDYKSYYQRIWRDDNGWFWIDVGSHSEFYIVKDD